MKDIWTIIIVVGLFLFSIYTIKNYIEKLGQGGCCSSDDTIKIKDRNIKNYPYHVTCEIEGMHCVRCSKRLETAFQSRGGILAKASYQSGKLELYMKEEMADEKIRKVIKNNGYILRSIQH